MKALLLLALLCACAPKPKPSGPAGASQQDYEAAANRLVSMLDGGWVVSRFPDGTARDQGDSLLFTGMAMGVLDCARGAVPEAALAQMLQENHGVPYRHPTIQNDYSLDGLLGLWWGIAKRTARCPEARTLWAGLLPEHKAAVSVEPYFGVVLQQVMADLGVGGAPSAIDRGLIGSEITLWAIGVTSSRQAGFRLHLGYLALSVVDAPKGKGTYCEAVKDAHIALIEHFCGRDGLPAWIQNFAYDRYVYAFQRAAWETPDGAGGLETPAVDLLAALSLMYPQG